MNFKIISILVFDIITLKVLFCNSLTTFIEFWGCFITKGMNKRVFSQPYTLLYVKR